MMRESNPTDINAELLGVVRAINDTCKRGDGFDKLASFFQDTAVIPNRDFASRVCGRDTIVKYYADACSQMKIRALGTSGEQIDTFGLTAVLSYKYDCVWEYKGKTFTDDGREILVFVRENEGWKIAWRTTIPGSCRIESAPAEREARSGVEGSVREICLDLMKTSPSCQLTVIDPDGFPHTTAMNNLRCARECPSLTELYEDQDTEFLLYLSTSMHSDKMACIQANPKASVYFCVPDQFIGLMLGGKIEIIKDQALKNRIWQQGWTMYYPNGPEGPEYGVLRLAPTTARGWLQGRPFEFKLS